MASERVIEDRLFIRQVANGWVVRAGRDEVDDMTHVYTTPEDLADHVKKWAEATAKVISK